MAALELTFEADRPVVYSFGDSSHRHCYAGPDGRLHELAAMAGDVLADSAVKVVGTPYVVSGVPVVPVEVEDVDNLSSTVFCLIHSMHFSMSSTDIVLLT